MPYYQKAKSEGLKVKIRNEPLDKLGFVQKWLPNHHPSEVNPQGVMVPSGHHCRFLTYLLNTPFLEPIHNKVPH